MCVKENLITNQIVCIEVVYVRIVCDKGNLIQSRSTPFFQESTKSSYLLITFSIITLMIIENRAL